jgi:beta-lactamase class A
VGGQEDGAVARTVRALARRFPGTCAAFVQDLRTGVGAAWNARARFPAASTLKVAIAVAVLRVHRGKPPPGSRLDRLLRRMLLASDAQAANELLIWLGGSTSRGGARVNATLRTLGLMDTEMFGGYEVTSSLSRRPKPIPRRVESQPAFGLGKYTTASDLARLMRQLHFAAGGKGLIVRSLRGSVTPSDARFLLFLLAHVGESGRLDRYLGGGTAVLEKAGWIEKARHDSGLVYWRGGAFVATVMTWNPRGAGSSSDVLAGSVARAALDRFRRRAGRGVKTLFRPVSAEQIGAHGRSSGVGRSPVHPPPRPPTPFARHASNQCEVSRASRQHHDQDEDRSAGRGRAEGCSGAGPVTRWLAPLAGTAAPRRVRTARGLAVRPGDSRGPRPFVYLDPPEDVRARIVSRLFGVLQARKSRRAPTACSAFASRDGQRPAPRVIAS